MTNNCCVFTLCSKCKLPSGLKKQLRTMFSPDVCFATEICSVPLLPSTRVKKGKALEFEKSDCVSGLFEEVLGLHPSCHPVKKVNSCFSNIRNKRLELEVTELIQIPKYILRDLYRIFNWRKSFQISHQIRGDHLLCAKALFQGLGIHQ